MAQAKKPRPAKTKLSTPKSKARSTTKTAKPRPVKKAAAKARKKLPDSGESIAVAVRTAKSGAVDESKAAQPEQAAAPANSQPETEVNELSPDTVTSEAPDHTAADTAPEVSSDDKDAAAAGATIRADAPTEAQNDLVSDGLTSLETTQPAPKITADPADKTDPLPAKAPQPPAGLSIQINFPAFRRPALTHAKKAAARLQPLYHKLRPYITRRRLLYAGSALLAIIITLSVVHAVQVHRRNVAATQAINAGRTQEAKPTFKPIVPAAKPALGIPDGTHSRFDSSHGSYSFIDSIGSAQFTVSEQQFPSSVSAQSAVGRAAQSLNATHLLQTKWGNAYVATIQRYSSQELVFSANNLLCFIQSANVLSDSQWTGYINSLH